MYIERVPNRNSPPAVLLRESWRENGKTQKRTVANLSSLSDETVEAVRNALKGQVVPAALAIAEPEKRLEITNVRQHGHVAAIVAMIKRSGLLLAIDPKPSRQRDIVVAMIADRLLHGEQYTEIKRPLPPHAKSTRPRTGASRLTIPRIIEFSGPRRPSRILPEVEGRAPGFPRAP